MKTTNRSHETQRLRLSNGVGNAKPNPNPNLHYPDPNLKTYNPEDDETERTYLDLDGGVVLRGNESDGKDGDLEGSHGGEDGFHEERGLDEMRVEDGVGLEKGGVQGDGHVRALGTVDGAEDDAGRDGLEEELGGYLLEKQEEQEEQEVWEGVG